MTSTTITLLQLLRVLFTDTDWAQERTSSVCVCVCVCVYIYITFQAVLSLCVLAVLCPVTSKAFCQNKDGLSYTSHGNPRNAGTFPLPPDTRTHAHTHSLSPPTLVLSGVAFVAFGLSARQQEEGDIACGCVKTWSEFACCTVWHSDVDSTKRAVRHETVFLFCFVSSFTRWTANREKFGRRRA